MPSRQFFLWNVIGGILWVDGVLLAGYLLAEQIVNAIGGPDQIDKYIVPFVLIIVAISAIPIFIEIVREHRARKRSRQVTEESQLTEESL
jgi:membrane-associated protein